MAWTKPLPDTAHAGDDGHVEDHNEIVDAITEIRTEVDKKGTSNLAIGTTATTAMAGNTTIPAAYTDAKAVAAVKAKTQIAALTAVAAGADAAALATAVNAIIAALKA